ncbi:gp41 domain protein [Burkholderia pseudomallei MSHR4378]|nr:gp41 domain protein [Burkholderia pseudomallei MSHR4378]
MFGVHAPRLNPRRLWLTRVQRAARARAHAAAYAWPHARNYGPPSARKRRAQGRAHALLARLAHRVDRPPSRHQARDRRVVVPPRKVEGRNARRAHRGIARSAPDGVDREGEEGRRGLQGNRPARPPSRAARARAQVRRDGEGIGSEPEDCVAQRRPETPCAAQRNQRRAAQAHHRSVPRFAVRLSESLVSERRSAHAQHPEIAADRCDVVLRARGARRRARHRPQSNLPVGEQGSGARLQAVHHAVRARGGRHRAHGRSDHLAERRDAVLPGDERAHRAVVPRQLLLRRILLGAEVPRAEQGRLRHGDAQALAQDLLQHAVERHARGVRVLERRAREPRPRRGRAHPDRHEPRGARARHVVRGRAVAADRDRARRDGGRLQPVRHRRAAPRIQRRGIREPADVPLHRRFAVGVQAVGPATLHGRLVGGMGGRLLAAAAAAVRLSRGVGRLRSGAHGRLGGPRRRGAAARRRRRLPRARTSPVPRQRL